MGERNHVTFTGKTVASAAISAAVVSAISWNLPFYAAWTFHGMLLVLTGGIYVGIALMDGRKHAVVWEGAQAILLAGAAVAAWAWHPAFLAVGWLLHPFWDLLHKHPLPAKTPSHLISWCLVFDVLVGISVLVQTFVVWSP